MPRVFLARPSYGPYEPEADYAAKCGVWDHDRFEVHAAAFRLSMTCANMNDHVCECMNRGGYDYFAMQHADIAPAQGWIEDSINEMERHGLQLVHAPARYKDESGITSTAVAYSDNVWMPCRRITTKELLDLPRTFDVETLREVYDSDAERMLFNTGCMVFKIGDWFDEFPGFHMHNTVVRRNGKWLRGCVSEDYVFAHWCANQGVRVGATKIPISHWGRKNYSTEEVGGVERDEQFYIDMQKIRESLSTHTEEAA